MKPSRTQAQEHASANRYTQRYAGDPLKCRLLMCLYCAHHNKSIAELAEPLHLHPFQVCKSLRMLVLDGLVSERGDTGPKTYSLANHPSARWLVNELLCRAIQTEARS